MTILLMFLKKWWKELLVAALVAGVLGYWYYLTSTIDKQERVINEQATQIKTLANDLKIQNDAVTKLKTDSDARIEAGLKAQKAAEVTAAANKKKAHDLAAAMAKYPQDLCRSANELIDGELK